MKAFKILCSAMVISFIMVGIGSAWETDEVIRSTDCNNPPTSGTGTQLLYHGPQDRGIIHSYDYTNGIYKDLLIGANSCQLYLKASGNVGIGTTSPDQKLTIKAVALDLTILLRIKSYIPQLMVFLNG